MNKPYYEECKKCIFIIIMQSKAKQYFRFGVHWNENLNRRVVIVVGIANIKQTWMVLVVYECADRSGWWCSTVDMSSAPARLRRHQRYMDEVWMGWRVDREQVCAFCRREGNKDRRGEVVVGDVDSMAVIKMRSI